MSRFLVLALGTMTMLLSPLITSADEVYPNVIPVQVAPSHPLHELFFDKAAKHVEPGESECAKFVNRRILAQFNVMMFGNAWDMQVKKSNLPYLEHVWQLEEDDFQRDNMLRLHHYTDRVTHFETLYETLEQEPDPIGVLGWVYHFSQMREYLSKNKHLMPQSHVSFLAGKKTFSIINETDEDLRIAELLEKKYGIIHPFERDFVGKKLPLEHIVSAGGSFSYRDYAVEEQARDLHSRSLMEVFLQKHRNNRVTPLFRPVSYSRMATELLQKRVDQKRLFLSLGDVEFIEGSQYASIDFEDKSRWNQFLNEKFGMTVPEKNIIVPVPKSVEVVGR